MRMIRLECSRGFGVDHDLPGVLSRDADASQIDAAVRAVCAGLIVRLPGAMDFLCGGSEQFKRISYAGVRHS